MTKARSNRLAIGVVLLASCLVSGHARADRWWGQDKALHLAAGLAIGASCSGTLLWASPSDEAEIRTLFCATLGQIPGLGKEIYDAGQPANSFSGKDLFWTAVGVLTSTLAIYAVERLSDVTRVRSPAAPPPSRVSRAR